MITVSDIPFPGKKVPICRIVRKSKQSDACNWKGDYLRWLRDNSAGAVDKLLFKFIPI